MNTPVKFTTAKLLEAKGFEQNPMKYINQCTMEGTLVFPTIAEVVMWLYEKHRIWITVYTMDKWSSNGNDREQLFDYSIKQMKLGLIDVPKKPEEFDSPTEAYESAIEYVLTNLI